MASPEMPPETKRTKLDHVCKDGIFSLFHSDTKYLSRLSDGRQSLAKEREGFLLLKIKSCNGHLPKTFTQAFCEVRRGVEDPEKGIQDIFFFQTVFKNGFRTLDAFLNSPHIIPEVEKPGEWVALERLLRFLMFKVEACNKALSLKKNEKITEVEWTMRLAHHLLSPLAVDQTYTMDRFYTHPPKGKDKCPCCDEAISGKFDDTSIGDVKVWHGCMDVIVGSISNQVPVHVSSHVSSHVTSDEDEEDDNHDYPDEPDSPMVNEISSNYESFFEQMVSETIVFSFLQKNLQPKGSSNYMIPTIGITREDVYIFMYDHKHDILLESTELKLRTRHFGQYVISLSTVIAVWLAINYKYFCSGTTDEMKAQNYTADFKERIAPAVYKVYKNEITHHCGSRTESNIKGFRASDHHYLRWK